MEIDIKLLDRLEDLAHNAKLRRLDFAQEMHDIVDELRAQLAPCGPDGMSAQSNSSHFRAWSAVVDALNEVRGTRRNWGADDALAPRDAAVAAIRSMAAQCSAQPAPDCARPMGVPAIHREQIDALVFANGFMYAKGHELIADQLAALVGWLRTNAPQE